MSDKFLMLYFPSSERYADQENLNAGILRLHQEAIAQKYDLTIHVVEPTNDPNRLCKQRQITLIREIAGGVYDEVLFIGSQINDFLFGVVERFPKFVLVSNRADPRSALKFYIQEFLEFKDQANDDTLLIENHPKS